MGDDIIVLKNKKIKSLMSKQEKNLIMNSSICDKNEKLKKVLSLFKGRIERKDLSKIEEIDKNIYRMIKTRDAVEEMRDSASQEWVQQKYLGKIKIPCELCGSIQSEDKFTIFNRINNNELKIGSSCIDKFPKMNNKLYGISIKEVAKLSTTSQGKLNKIIKFNELYSGGKSIFTDWKNKYDEFNIIFPKSYDEEFSDILKQGRRIYNSYINGKININEVKRFKTYTDAFQYFYNKCIKFHNDNNGNRYICTKKIAIFLKDKGLKSTFSYIQDKGKIKADVAKYIYHIDFVNRFENDIQAVFDKYDLTLKKISEQYINFSYEYINFEPIVLENSLKEFTCKFSDIFYGISDFSKSYIFKGLNVKNNYSNVYNYLGVLEYILKGTGYYFEIDEELYEKQIIELNKVGLNKFAILDLKYILKNYSEILYLSKVNSKNVLLNYINKIDNWTNKSDKEKYDIGNISEVWAK